MNTVQCRTRQLNFKEHQSAKYDNRPDETHQSYGNFVLICMTSHLVYLPSWFPSAQVIIWIENGVLKDGWNLLMKRCASSYQHVLQKAQLVPNWYCGSSSIECSANSGLILVSTSYSPTEHPRMNYIYAYSLSVIFPADL